MKVGLTIGKYAPLHKGHQLVIEQAMKEMDLVIAIVYEAPEIPELPLALRVKWLKMLYPKIVILKAENVPKEKGYSEAIQNKHVQYILDLLKGQKIDAFYSSEPYGSKMSKALNCENRVVDMDRKQVTISGSEIRKDVVNHQQYLDTLVFKDLIEIYPIEEGV